MFGGSCWKSESTLLKNPVDIWGSSSQPALDINFVNGRAFDSRITFTRTTTATYFNQAGLLATAAINGPRIEYDPVTHESKGFLVEAAGTNLLTYSEQFDNAAWTKSNSSITANAVVAPDGALTADKWIENTATSTHIMSRIGGTTPGTQQTISVYAKAAERTRVSFADAGVEQTVFNLSTGTIESIGTGSVPTITNVGGGWYRLTDTRTWVYSTPYILLRDNTSTVAYTGDGVSGIYIWGAQLEANNVATSYIPTIAATVTRALDLAVMTGSNFSDWYNPTEWTMVCEAEGVYKSGTSAVPWAISSASTLTDGAYLSHFYGATNRLRAFGFIATSAAGDLYPSTTHATRSVINSAFGYVVNNLALAVNGVTPTLDTSFAGLGTMDRLVIGSIVGSSQLNGHIKRLTYYNKRVSNTELQALSS